MTQPEIEAGKSGKFKVAPPWEVELSPRVVAKYGFKDGRVEIGVKPGSLLPRVWLTITLEEFLGKVEPVIPKIAEWAKRAEADRSREGAI